VAPAFRLLVLVWDNLNTHVGDAMGELATARPGSHTNIETLT
jgi:hypothetical protein